MNVIDKNIIEWFNSDFGTNFSGGAVGNLLLVFVSLLAAAAFSAVIGYERETHGHNAGFRTHLLVAVGSATVMIVSIYGFPTFDNLNESGRDPARLAAQVISGIGFLGAGTIIKSGISVRGLTTATTLWVCMAIGLAAGAGCFCIAACASVVSIITLISMRRLEKFASKKNPFITMVYDSDKAAMKDVIEVSSRYGITIHNITTELIDYQGHPGIRLCFRCASADPSSVNAFCDELRVVLKPYELQISTEY